MIHWLFKCIGCKQSLNELGAFPLCSICQDSLVPCPPLCKHCGSPICPTHLNEQCLRPWNDTSLIQSYSARYILLGHGYAVLKRWKLHRGSIFDRRILKSDPEHFVKWIDLGIEAIVPIPQRFSRSWQMRGSRSLKIAEWISSETKLPILQLLLSTPRVASIKRQAELSLKERLENPIRFEPNLELSKNIQLPSNILLIDDFFTTGHTLRQAAQALKSLSGSQIHVFCLGLRPALANTRAKI